MRKSYHFSSANPGILWNCLYYSNMLILITISILGWLYARQIITEFVWYMKLQYANQYIGLYCSWFLVKLTLRAIWSSPMSIADTFSRFQIVDSVFRTWWQTFVNLLVDNVAISPFPSSFTIALSINASSMFRAIGIFTIDFFASFPWKSEKYRFNSFILEKLKLECCSVPRRQSFNLKLEPS